MVANVVPSALLLSVQRTGPWKLLKGPTQEPFRTSPCKEEPTRLHVDRHLERILSSNQVLTLYSSTRWCQGKGRHQKHRCFLKMNTPEDLSSHPGILPLKVWTGLLADVFWTSTMGEMANLEADLAQITIKGTEIYLAGNLAA